MPDRVDGQDSTEREIVISLLVSKEFNERVVPHWQDRRLEATQYVIIARWLVDHFINRGEVLGTVHNLEQIFFDHLTQGTLSKAQGELVEGTLSIINEKIQARGGAFNFEDQWDHAIQYFRKRDIDYGMVRATEWRDQDINKATAALAASLKPSLARPIHRI
jgi:hypothetical protein